MCYISALALAGCGIIGGDDNEPKRDPSGKVTESSDSADVFALKVGDCTGAFADGDEVENLPVIPCEKPHEFEVFSRSNLPDGDFPGDEDVTTAANKACTSEFKGFVGVKYDLSELFVNFLVPTKETWKEGDREILCMVYAGDKNENPVKTEGSLKGANR